MQCRNLAGGMARRCVHEKGTAVVEAHTPTPPAAAPVEVTSTLPAIAADGIECPQHVGIVGLGLIGGSLAVRLRSAGCAVSAWNHRAHPYETAARIGIECKDTLEELVEAQPDVLVLCNPLVAMPKILQTIKPITVRVFPTAASLRLSGVSVSS